MDLAMRKVVVTSPPEVHARTVTSRRPTVEWRGAKQPSLRSASARPDLNNAIISIIVIVFPLRNYESNYCVKRVPLLAFRFLVIFAAHASSMCCPAASTAGTFFCVRTGSG
jgi:hypothetical protein